MKAKYAGIAFCAAGMLAVGYFMAHPLLPRAEAQGEKAKAGRYQIVIPPSAMINWPVMALAASLARKAMTLATS